MLLVCCSKLLLLFGLGLWYYGTFCFISIVLCFMSIVDSLGWCMLFMWWYYVFHVIQVLFHNANAGLRCFMWLYVVSMQFLSLLCCAMLICAVCMIYCVVAPPPSPPKDDVPSKTAL